MNDTTMADDVRVNDEIDADEVRLVDREGEQIGVLALDEALAHAARLELELVEVEADAKPPVCRLMSTDELARRYADDDQDERPRVLREIRLGTADALADEDIEQARAHLERGDPLKLTIEHVGRGDEALAGAGEAFDHVAVVLEDVAIVEISPRRAGRGMAMFLEPR